MESDRRLKKVCLQCDTTVAIYMLDGRFAYVGIPFRQKGKRSVLAKRKR